MSSGIANEQPSDPRRQKQELRFCKIEAPYDKPRGTFSATKSIFDPNTVPIVLVNPEVELRGTEFASSAIVNPNLTGANPATSSAGCETGIQIMEFNT